MRDATPRERDLRRLHWPSKFEGAASPRVMPDARHPQICAVHAWPSADLKHRNKKWRAHLGGY